MFHHSSLNDVFETEIGDEIENMMRNDERGRAAGFAARLPCNGAQRLAMKMIEMGMRNQDDVHGRQVAQVQAGLAQAL